jgi:acylglycerol lipase
MRPPLSPPEFHAWRMSDGYPLRGRVWRARGGAGGRAVLYLHGIQSHGGWFEWSASVLADAGAAVVLPDRRGSGLNEQARGDVAHRRRWLQDLDELSDWIARNLRPSRIDVVGVSWGGKLAAAWAVDNPNTCNRLMLIAPGVFPAVDVGPAERLRIGAALITRSTKPFPIPLSDPALFTDNPASRAFIEHDELKLTHATARFLYHSTRLDQHLRRRPRGAIQCETALVMAGRERIIRNDPTLAWLKRVAWKHLGVHMFPDACHTLEFESDVTGFEALLRTWQNGPPEDIA